MARPAVEVVICGAGIAGVATAYFLSAVGGISDVVIVDHHAPLSQTSSRSGENYRSWWPHPVMARLTSRSITLMDELARASGNMFQMHRRGYLYASFEPSTRATLAAHLEPYGHLGIGSLRIHAVPAARRHTGRRPRTSATRSTARTCCSPRTSSSQRFPSSAGKCRRRSTSGGPAPSAPSSWGHSSVRRRGPRRAVRMSNLRLASLVG